jgi:hypothetical protein
MTMTTTGGAAGLAGVTAALLTLFGLLSNADVLKGLYAAAVTHQPTDAVFQVGAAALALVFAGILTMVSALFHPSPNQPPKAPAEASIPPTLAA